MKEKNELLFKKKNYMLMILGVVMVILGFILMAGGGSNDPNVFNNDKVYGFQRITLAPILVIGGFVVEFFAIFKK